MPVKQIPDEFAIKGAVMFGSLFSLFLAALYIRPEKSHSLRPVIDGTLSFCGMLMASDEKENYYHFIGRL
ncbi:MAG: hypothetical protein A2W25_15565 [candidate division Zixibacteria bacterium RBG_16_53_22]|nr:MAG: hypothetical protein A2W25_15565 [candidate division Zixibacteria bacterium RBG_16_53_22]